MDDPEHWRRYGPGAVGVGWDLALLGLARHLQSQPIENPDQWRRTPEARRFITGSSQAWGAAHQATGAARDAVAAAVQNTTNGYPPDPGTAG